MIHLTPLRSEHVLQPFAYNPEQDFILIAEKMVDIRHDDLSRCGDSGLGCAPRPTGSEWVYGGVVVRTPYIQHRHAQLLQRKRLGHRLAIVGGPHADTDKRVDTLESARFEIRHRHMHAATVGEKRDGPTSLAASVATRCIQPWVTHGKQRQVS